jgi:thymidylate synthase ThyX
VYEVCEREIMFSASVVAHSKSETGKEIISLQLHYPKFIHGELMTHRVFSRNASSSRAIPFEKFVKEVENDPAVPCYWGHNEPGMQANEEVDEHSQGAAINVWHNAKNAALWHAKQLALLGVHKQIVNRLLEPFYHINTLVTSTEWDNFFELRDHPDAQPEIQALAKEMKKAISKSKPNLLEIKQWHLPYIKKPEYDQHDITNLIKMSVARCARVSYKTHDDKLPEAIKDLLLYERLVIARPLHASPAEHQATPDPIRKSLWNEYHGNFKGWIQYRKLLEAGLNPDKIWRDE